MNIDVSNEMPIEGWRSVAFLLNEPLYKPVSSSAFRFRLSEVFRGALALRPFALRGLSANELASLKLPTSVSP